jgi:exopolysaccharide biosynthesis polyprenyl glycosylphosphotransferase
MPHEPLAVDDEQTAVADDLVRRLVAAGVPFRVPAAMFEDAYCAARDAGISGLSVAETPTGKSESARWAAKRALDVALAGAGLVVSLPIMAVAAAAISIDSPGPVLFRQERLGKWGRPFTIIKFRTMVADAEERLERLLSHDEGDGPHFKMRDDPRVTRVGAVLRRWSIDELPQLFNVLRGDMSLVGPRPPLPREVADYGPSDLCRLRGKPGITGMWQASGRKELTFDDMVRLDRYYIEHWSLRLDLRILLKTVKVVFARRGAY